MDHPLSSVVLSQCQCGPSKRQTTTTTPIHASASVATTPRSSGRHRPTLAVVPPSAIHSDSSLCATTRLEGTPAGDPTSIASGSESATIDMTNTSAAPSGAPLATRRCMMEIVFDARPHRGNPMSAARGTDRKLSSAKGLGRDVVWSVTPRLSGTCRASGVHLPLPSTAVSNSLQRCAFECAQVHDPFCVILPPNDARALQTKTDDVLIADSTGPLPMGRPRLRN